MTIEDAIRRCRETARGFRNRAEAIAAMGLDDTDCAECAAENEQLAEWLIELKQRKEQEKQHGRWVFVNGYYFWKTESPYCPNCGADMRGGAK